LNWIELEHYTNEELDELHLQCQDVLAKWDLMPLCQQLCNEVRDELLKRLPIEY